MSETKTPPAPPVPAAPAPEAKRSTWFGRVGGRLKLIARRRRRPPERDSNPSSGLRILIVTDAWVPQVNGVVRTLETLGAHVKALGNDVRYITPDLFRTLPLPSYPEIRLALAPMRRIRQIIHDFQPDAIHVATEGPLGLAARRFCLRREHPFTTSFHTRFPEYLHARTRVPVEWGYRAMRWFHRPASALMVATPSLKKELEERGFRNIRLWARGVDLNLFHPCGNEDDPQLAGFPRPIWLYVGRVAVEKNIEAFLALPLEGTKVVVGEGPQLQGLKTRFPETRFLGVKFGEELTRIYSASDVFVFPSKTDTLGLVNLEALACGTPVAAYDVQGPRDIIAGAPVGACREDLLEACRAALGIATVEACRAHALKFSWENSARQFLANLDIPGYDEAYWAESATIQD